MIVGWYVGWDSSENNEVDEPPEESQRFWVPNREEDKGCIQVELQKNHDQSSWVLGYSNVAGGKIKKYTYVPACH